ncbi:universal stress protein [Tenacibaculum sp. MEBiC06402]|uniref:universal stress protein n=1 Tax=unclassified Tenacibaculum TaxID=2635139 RepID=UPI003B9A2FA1
MKNILLPIDFSKNSLDALFYTIKLFKDRPCNFYILHTFEVKTPLFTSRMNKEKGRLTYENNLESVQDKFNDLLMDIAEIPEAENHSFETLAITKPLIQTIHKTIEMRNIDLVVMGTKGASGLKEVLFGSNTVKVLKSIYHTPLLIVPEEADKFTLDKIAFATAFKNGYKESSLAFLSMLCKLFKSELEIVYLDDQEPLTLEEAENKKYLENTLEGVNFNFKYVNKTKSTEKHIREYVGGLDFDLLVMIKYGHDDFYNWTNEPVINKLGYRTKLPFLILPNE